MKKYVFATHFIFPTQNPVFLSCPQAYWEGEGKVLSELTTLLRNLLFLYSECLGRVKEEWESFTLKSEVEGFEMTEAREDALRSDARVEEEGQSRKVENQRPHVEVKDQLVYL